MNSRLLCTIRLPALSLRVTTSHESGPNREHIHLDRLLLLLFKNSRIWSFPGMRARLRMIPCQPLYHLVPLLTPVVIGLRPLRPRGMVAGSRSPRLTRLPPSLLVWNTPQRLSPTFRTSLVLPPDLRGLAAGDKQSLSRSRRPASRRYKQNRRRLPTGPRRLENRANLRRISIGPPIRPVWYSQATDYGGGIRVIELPSMNQNHELMKGLTHDA